MGVIGFLLGAIVGWLATSYIVGALPIAIPCLLELWFFCLIGPHIVIAIIIGYVLSKMIPI